MLIDLARNKPELVADIAFIPKLLIISSDKSIDLPVKMDRRFLNWFHLCGPSLFLRTDIQSSQYSSILERRVTIQES
jgi:hypothetical protein